MKATAKTWRPWTNAEDAILRASWGKRSVCDIAADIGRTRSAIENHAHTLKLSAGRLYSDEEKQIIRDMYDSHTAAQISERLFGTPRCAKAVYGLAHKLGLRKWPDRRELYEPIRRLHADGLTDRGIAQRLSISHDMVKDIRRMRLKLPTIPDVEAKRQAVRSQLKTLGLTSPTQLRTRAFRKFAIANGWPECLKPREVQILNCLAVHGPQTSKEISDRLGLKPKHKKCDGGIIYLSGANPFRRNGVRLPGGTYTAMLMARGLVMRQKRWTRHQTRRGSKGKQISSIYMLTAAAVAMVQGRIESERNNEQNGERGTKRIEPQHTVVA